MGLTCVKGRNAVLAFARLISNFRNLFLNDRGRERQATRIWDNKYEVGISRLKSNKRVRLATRLTSSNASLEVLI